MIRHIQPAMVDWLRSKLAGFGLFADALARKDARTIYLLANQACVGIREKTGHNDGPLVELMQRTVGTADGESWCMSAQQTCVAFAEELTGVASLLPVGEHCMTVWRASLGDLRVQTIPLPGALTIWNHAGSDAGHCGCVGSYDLHDGTFESYEGNTGRGIGAGGEVQREGDGFYRTQRRNGATGNMRLVGWLKPFPKLIAA